MPDSNPGPLPQKSDAIPLSHHIYLPVPTGTCLLVGYGSSSWTRSRYALLRDKAVLFLSPSVNRHRSRVSGVALIRPLEKVRWHHLFDLGWNGVPLACHPHAEKVPSQLKSSIFHLHVKAVGRHAPLSLLHYHWPSRISSRGLGHQFHA